MLGIIFSNIHDASIPELTTNTTMAGIPFGGRYRLIDFILSAMVNSGVTQVGVITKNHYRGLMIHVGSGKPWDLARKNGGLFILPPYGDTTSESLYSNRLEAIMGTREFLENSQEEYVIMSDSDIIASVDYADAFDQHVKTGADITGIYFMSTAQQARNYTEFQMDNSGRITDLAVYYSPATDSLVKCISMNMWIMKRELLLRIIRHATAHALTSFSREILAPNLGKYKVMGYKYNGYSKRIDSLKQYYDVSMDLLNSDVREELFKAPGRPVYTSVQDSPPTKYIEGSNVSNSLVADGCIIEGTVKNSILFRGVKVSRGAVVENSVVMRDTAIESESHLKNLIIGEGVTITSKTSLSGQDTYPFFIKDRSIV